MLNNSLNKVYETKEYDMFSYIDGNRGINKAHLKRITISLSKKSKSKQKF